MSEQDGAAAAPVIVLVEPTLSMNVGSVARVMANFGLRELRIVAPVCDPLDAAAQATAAGGLPVLEALRVYPTLLAAVEDVGRVWATTGLDRTLSKPWVHPRALAGELRASPARAALVFGPERTGLRNEHLVLADGLVRIPTNPDCRALNLSQSVGILAWEWSCAEGPVEAPEGPEPAPKGEVLAMVEALEATLVDGGRFPDPILRERAFRNLRASFLRATFTSAEVRTLRGIWRMLG